METGNYAALKITRGPLKSGGGKTHLSIQPGFFSPSPYSAASSPGKRELAAVQAGNKVYGIPTSGGEEELQPRAPQVDYTVFFPPKVCFFSPFFRIELLPPLSLQGDLRSIFVYVSACVTMI